MAKYRSYAEFEKAFKKNTKKIEKELAKSMPEVGEIMVKDIKKRTRLGFGVSDNGASKSRLKKLEDSTKRYRRWYDRARGGLGDGATPTKSNLTLSGNMLDSLKARSTGDFSVRVEPTGNDAGISNKEKAEYVSVVRPFLFLSKPEIKRITKFLRKELDSIIKKLF